MMNWIVRNPLICLLAIAGLLAVAFSFGIAGDYRTAFRLGVVVAALALLGAVLDWKQS